MKGVPKNNETQKSPWCHSLNQCRKTGPALMKNNWTSFDPPHPDQPPKAKDWTIPSGLTAERGWMNTEQNLQKPRPSFNKAWFRRMNDQNRLSASGKIKTRHLQISKKILILIITIFRFNGSHQPIAHSKISKNQFTRLSRSINSLRVHPAWH